MNYRTTKRYQFPITVDIDVVPTTILDEVAGYYVTEDALIPATFDLPVRHMEPAPVFARIATIESKPARACQPKGFLVQTRLTPKEREVRSDITREWLNDALRSGPRAAVEVLEQARLEGIAIRTLPKVKRRLGVKSIKRGGSQHGWGSVWFWTPPANSQA